MGHDCLTVCNDTHERLINKSNNSLFSFDSTDSRSSTSPSQEESHYQGYLPDAHLRFQSNGLHPLGWLKQSASVGLSTTILGLVTVLKKHCFELSAAMP
ncbi:hypothetical protein AVEN_52683-1 [Araneus ventricosus]|uniref:Uncharacterized protein n=1 Tax=Araneus ventricosus TaxID=182803 RepID=A0A4Y2HDU7_ARAVE|nr:hypothetical protein AVEN_52682-1 [Araneus ventricosus]GBM63465.1 hypothetical protein AVEN_52683-1 [Araneus ventricosus]